MHVDAKLAITISFDTRKTHRIIELHSSGTCEVAIYPVYTGKFNSKSVKTGAVVQKRLRKDASLSILQSFHEHNLML